ncbi:MAG: MaoC/PaaZ C-terminal domain-containing protein [Eggerthellaceae bacterium]
MLQAPLYFEDVEVGYKFQSPGGRTITNAEVVNFAQITGDYNLVHLDHEFAKTGMYGENIAHGPYADAGRRHVEAHRVLVGHGRDAGRPHGLQAREVHAPVKFNSTIHLECEITDKTDNGDGTAPSSWPCMVSTRTARWFWTTCATTTSPRRTSPRPPSS